VFLPLHRNLSASPHPNSINFVVTLHSVDSEHRETVFFEVFDVSQVSVFQVVGQIAHDSFAFILDVLDLPQRPSLVVKLAPELTQSGLLVLGVTELTFPVVDVEV